MTDAKQKQQPLQQALQQQQQQQQQRVSDSSAEVYPYSANDAIRPNAPLPASLSHPHSNVTALTQPTSSTTSTHPPPTSDVGLTSTSALLHTLVELSIDVKRMCVEDGGKTAGTTELAQRMDELRQVLAEHTDLIFAHCSSTHLHTALLSLRTTMLSAHLILHKAVNTAFRRSHKFKQPIRITINDTLIGLSKLTSAISLAVATSSSSSAAHSATAVSSLPTVQLLDGQEESVLGDKYYYGHGLPVDYVKALHLYTIAADKGYHPAMVSLATMMREGTGRKKDTLGALSWYRKAAEGGNVDAANALGQMYEAGEGVVRNLETAIEWYQQAANGGHVDAQTNLGYIYEHGSEDVSTQQRTCLVYCPTLLCCAVLPPVLIQHSLIVLRHVVQEMNYVPVDIDAAAAWYREAAEKGYAKAMNNLAYLHYLGLINGKKEYEEAVRWFRQAAEQGNAGALNNLGIAYESGKGVERDEEMALQMYAEAASLGHVSAQSSLGYLYLKQRRFALALDWLRKAADAKDREALYHLAQMYHHGLHVQRDDQHAYQLYNKAADLSHPYALLELGHALFTGRGTKKDVDRAFLVYKQSAELGVSEAENSVGVMMEEGVGVLRDVKGAREWYERAAGRGNGDAMFNLGLMLDSGVCGEERDEQKAMDWYRKAAAHGSQHAVKRLEQQESRRKVDGHEGLVSPAGRTQPLPQVPASAVPQ